MLPVITERQIDTEITEAVLNRIEDASLLIARFGCWPSFHDAELIDLQFERGNLLQVFDTKEWYNAVYPTLIASFSVPDESVCPIDYSRLTTNIRLRFSDVRDVVIDGLNHQNPITGLGIKLVSVENSELELFNVEWGGAVIRHEVSFSCERIKVELVTEIGSQEA